MKAVSGKDMLRALKQRGWTVVRVTGSHHHLRKLGCLPVCVPVHGNRSLPLGIQRQIMRDAELTDADL